MTAIVKFLPEEKSHEATRLLPYVMAVMVYLSALALMGSLMLHKGFGDWTESLSNRLTVQVTQADKTRRDAMVDDVTALLKQTPGIKAVRRLSDAEIDELLEPWLGVGNVAEDLPIPALLDVTVSRDIALNLDALRQQMQQISPDISLDDHQKWLGRFLRLMDTVEYTALGILILVILATICIVIFGTKAGMAEHRDTISIIHHLGAHDHMIARAYQNRFMKYGLTGGIIGLVLAFITLVSLIYLSRDVASGLVKTPELPVMESAALLVIPLFAALISMLTARITVLRDLGRMV
ncbi:cell division protein FtsX [Paremcibacter congregatus]|uniref:ABC3 transporter permease C-terminal domain-containing protein n=1 Tax=Paremcibacter congregatus TaxID=2043170 RepID=A0A2G4YPX4_9PROT|nr:FtsX-like permease family protein [Paremcibacter congregatus]PHZ84368.1 hypothetical protein CRD36_11160 [Paremcibacter congregatus]QDE28588.1 hypothetical protein FIV45_15570 [Paremcibacter congregatus]